MTSPIVEPGRARWPWIIIAAIAVAAVGMGAYLAGSGSDPAAAPSPAAATTATADRGKEACSGVAQLGEKLDYDPTKYEGYAEMAIRTADSAVLRAAARTLADDAEKARWAVDEPSRNLKLEQAALDFADACAQAYGDGGW